MRRTMLGSSIVTLIAITLSLVGGVLGASRARASDTAIVDTLGAATPETTFSVFGSGGNAITATQLVGPRFTLTEKTAITEIGGFVNNCPLINQGVPDCPGALPITVQIRPSNAGGIPSPTAGGVPHPSKVLATVALSDDGDPLVFSYESASTNLILEEGTYFALFAPQGDDEGGTLLSSAQIPFSYQAGTTTLGFLDPTSTNSLRFSGDTFAAVRILGHPVVQEGFGRYQARCSRGEPATWCDPGHPRSRAPGGASKADSLPDCRLTFPTFVHGGVFFPRLGRLQQTEPGTATRIVPPPERRSHVRNSTSSAHSSNAVRSAAGANRTSWRRFSRCTSSTPSRLPRTRRSCRRS
jgi:hypothetical protein